MVSRSCGFGDPSAKQRAVKVSIRRHLMKHPSHPRTSLDSAGLANRLRTEPEMSSLHPLAEVRWHKVCFKIVPKHRPSNS
jgi:hypothetical protein